MKRFIRDYVDARLSIAEFLLPLLVVIMVMQYSGSASWCASAPRCGASRSCVVAVDTIVAAVPPQAGAARRSSPTRACKGTTFYTIMRVLQLRWLRMPKPQVKVGGAPR